jgi:hypothetical protein
MSNPTGIELVAVALLLNIPFGAYRFTVRKLSWRWFLAIHVPIPAIFILRISAGYGYQFIPWLLAGAIAGQILGSRLFAIWHARRHRIGEIAAAVDGTGVDGITPADER